MRRVQLFSEKSRLKDRGRIRELDQTGSRGKAESEDREDEVHPCFVFTDTRAGAEIRADVRYQEGVRKFVPAGP